MDMWRFDPTAPAPAERPVDGFLRRVCASPIFLVAAIVFSLSTALSLASNLTAILPNLGTLFEAFEEMIKQTSHLGPDLVVCLLVLFVAVMAALVHSLVVPLCFTVAIWLIYAYAVGTRSGPVPTGGMTVTRVSAILSLVLQCLAYVGLLGSIGYLFGRLAVMLGEYGVSLAEVLEEALDYLPAGFLVTLLLEFLLCMVFMVLSVIQTVMVLKMANDTGHALRYSSMPPQPPAVVGVTLILSGLFSFASPFLTAQLAYAAMGGMWTGYGDMLGMIFEQMNWLAKVVWVLGSVSPILLAVLLFVARGIWKRSQSPFFF